MTDSQQGLSLDEILAEQGEPPEIVEGRSDGWPTITGEALALISIRDCFTQLRLAPEEPLRIAQAAKSAHLAMQAALTAALSGSMGIGAYNAKLERKWLAFLQDGGEQPRSNRVMDFDQLLEKARSKPLEWTGAPLSVTEDEAAALTKLTMIRHGIEHPKPGFWVIEPAYIFAVIPVAIRLAITLLETVAHHLEPDDLPQIRNVQVDIEAMCAPDKSSVSNK